MYCDVWGIFFYIKMWVACLLARQPVVVANYGTHFLLLFFPVKLFSHKFKHHTIWNGNMRIHNINFAEEGSVDDFLFQGYRMKYPDMQVKKMKTTDFRQNFGVSPEVASTVYNYCQEEIGPSEHLLWVLHYLKNYLPVRQTVKICKTSTKNFYKVLWVVLDEIAGLAPIFVSIHYVICVCWLVCYLNFSNVTISIMYSTDRLNGVTV